LPLLPSL